MTSEVTAALLDASLVPAEGTKAHPVFRDDAQRVVAIGLAAGAELAPHAAPGRISIQVVRGRVALTHGEGEIPDAGPGTWLHLPAGMVHAVAAHEPSLVLVTLAG